MKFTSIITSFALATGFSTALEQNYDLSLKTLVISKSAARDTAAQRAVVAIPKFFLEGVGTRFDILTSLPALDTPAYGSIVVGETSDLSPEEWTAVRNYCDKYGVKLVSLFSNPADVAGVSLSSRDAANTLAFDASAIANELTSINCNTCSWNFAEFSDTQANVATITDTENVKPILEVLNGAAKSGKVAAVIQKNSQHEEMHFFFDSRINEMQHETWENAAARYNLGEMSQEHNYEYTYLNMAMANVWYDFITEGMYLGKRRISIQMHIDDWFAVTDMYSSKGNGTNFRVGPNAPEFSKKWAEETNAKLPAGSDIRVELAFNGASFEADGSEGEWSDVPESKGLSAMSQKLMKDFHWVSHTYTHQNLDWLEGYECYTQLGGTPNVDDTCRTPEQRLRDELKLNDMVLTGEDIFIDQYPPYGSNCSTYPTPEDPIPDACLTQQDTRINEFFKNDMEAYKLHVSPNSMVPPEISGLWPSSVTPPADRLPKAVPKNKEAIGAIVNHGITTVTGDNSRAEIRNLEHAHHGIYTTVEEYGVAGLLIIPRVAVNIFFNVHTPEVYMDQYITSNCCPWSTGYKCPEKDSPEQKSQTYDDAMDRQARVTTSPWLQFRQDPHMFHQGNLNPYLIEGKNTSLVSDWFDRSVARLMNYVDKLPIKSPKMDDIGDVFRKRMARDECAQLEAKLIVRDGKRVQVELSGDNNCNAEADFTILNKAYRENAKTENPNVKQESYGPELTLSAQVSPGTTQIIKLSSTTNSSMTVSPTSTSETVSATSAPTTDPSPTNNASSKNIGLAFVSFTLILTRFF